MRVSDADRAQIAERLRHATEEGRLFAHEFDDRLGQTLDARTYGQLDALVADLPPEHELVRRRSSRTAIIMRRRVGTLVRRPRQTLLAVTAGALATAAVAIPVLATDASSAQRPSVRPQAGDRCSTSAAALSATVVPCGYPNHVSNAEARAIDNSAGMPLGGG